MEPVAASSPRMMTKSSPIVLPPLGHSADKENQCERNPTPTPTSPSAPHNFDHVKSKGARTMRLLASDERSSTPSASYHVFSSGIAKNTSPARVLRLGETVESLFLLRPQSSGEYRELCMQLVHDAEAAQNPQLWIQVLREVMIQQTQNGRDEDEDSRDLIRLHHRAMARFVLSPDTLPIWLSYARAQAHQKEDALLTLRHAARVGSSIASFYVTKANLYCERWGNLDEGIKILQQGIQQNAQPMDELTARLNELLLHEKRNSPIQQQQSSNSCLRDGHQPLEKSDITERLNNKHCMQGSFPTRNASDGNHHSQKVSRSSSKRDYCDVQQIDSAGTPTDKKYRRLTPHQLGKSAVKGWAKVPSSRKRPPLIDSRLLQRTGADLFVNQPRLAMMADSPNRAEGSSTSSSEPTHFPKCDLKYIKTWDPEKGRRKSSEMAKQTESAPSPSTRELSRMNVSVSEHSAHAELSAILQSPRARKSSVKLDVSYMKAWNPELPHRKSQDRMSIDKTNAPLTSEIPCLQSVDKAPSLNQEPSICKARKPPRFDMTYIQEWDPEKYRRGSITTPDPAKGKDTTAKTNSVPSLASASGSVDSGAVEDSKPVKYKKVCEEENQQTITLQEGSPIPITCNQNLCRKTINQAQTAAEKSKESLKGASTNVPEDLGSLDEYNKDFLPLVHQDNMLTVNGIAYAKMGVIGKGGSCKVYRALSKDGHVLAIKKVKLAGLQQNAIKGYANEIALLKRLRGNPSIIQMFDSQIDLPQKAIFLVMEPGEADLNHVLQQHLSNDSAGSSFQAKRDMNFIRLTWQQMLKAVNCIHEERIVHGDLKPANFLFVRGKLKLIDFGIAKTIQSDDTTNIYRDSQVGTVNYMSPESLMNETGDKQWKMGRVRLSGTEKCFIQPDSQPPEAPPQASDIWSLGCILYQMIYGKTPFADLHMIQKIQAIINPNYEISFPPIADDAAIDCMKQCLRYKADQRPPIVGPHGLLNEHRFLNATN